MRGPTTPQTQTPATVGRPLFVRCVGLQFQEGPEGGRKGEGDKKEKRRSLHTGSPYRSMWRGDVSTPAVFSRGRFWKRPQNDKSGRPVHMPLRPCFSVSGGICSLLTPVWTGRAALRRVDAVVDVLPSLASSSPFHLLHTPPTHFPLLVPHPSVLPKAAIAARARMKAPLKLRPRRSRRGVASQKDDGHGQNGHDLAQHYRNISG